MGAHATYYGTPTKIAFLIPAFQSFRGSDVRLVNVLWDRGVTPAFVVYQWCLVKFLLPVSGIGCHVHDEERGDDDRDDHEHGDDHDR